MALGARYTAEFYSMNDIRYKIEILEDGYTGSSSDFNIGMNSLDGFTLSYDGRGGDRYKPIIASSCVINCVVEDSAFETLISDIQDAQEQKYFLKISKHTGSSWEIFWAGLVLQDIIEKEDFPKPYLFQLHAIDGISRLKDIDYPGTEGTAETFIDYLITIIGKIGTTDNWETGQTILKTAITWYEDKMYTSPLPLGLDPLAQSKVYNEAFLSRDEHNALEKMSCYDVLEQIAIRWGARFMLSNGYFALFNLNILEDGSFQTINYNKSGTKLSYGNVDYSYTVSHRTGNLTYFQPLLKTSVIYQFKQGIDPGNLLPPQTNYVSTVDIGNIQGGAGERLVFSGNIFAEFNVTTPFIDPHRWVWDLKLQVGSYYLTNKNGYLEWSTTSSDRYRIISHSETGHASYTLNIPVSFITPDIPTTGSGYFSFAFVKFIDPNGNTWTPPSGVTYDYACQDFTLRLWMDTAWADGEKEIIAENYQGGVLVKSTTEFKLPDIYTGDGPYNYSSGRIIVYNDSTSTWENSEEDWTVNGSGTGISINKLLVQELLAGQRKACEIYTGEIYGNITALSILEFDSNKYFFLGGDFNAWADKWSADWVEIIVDNTGINPNETRLDERYPGGERMLLGMNRQRIYDVETEMRLGGKITGKKTTVSANYTINEDERIIYISGLSASITITLPDYDETENNLYTIVNADSTYSVSIAAGGSNKINGSISSYTLAADSSVQIHNSGISTIEWATIVKASRK